jgi:hypothetical protein
MKREQASERRALRTLFLRYRFKGTGTAKAANKNNAKEYRYAF